MQLHVAKMDGWWMKRGAGGGGVLPAGRGVRHRPPPLALPSTPPTTRRAICRVARPLYIHIVMHDGDAS